MTKVKVTINLEYSHYLRKADANHALQLCIGSAAGRGELLDPTSWDCEVFVCHKIDLKKLGLNPELDPTELDDLIHELKAEEAAAINDLGISGQIEYIFERFGKKRGIEFIKNMEEQ